MVSVVKIKVINNNKTNQMSDYKGRSIIIIIIMILKYNYNIELNYSFSNKPSFPPYFMQSLRPRNSGIYIDFLRK